MSKTDKYVCFPEEIAQENSNSISVTDDYFAGYGYLAVT